MPKFEKLHKRIDNTVKVLSTVAALFTAIVGVLNVIAGALPAKTEETEKDE